MESRSNSTENKQRKKMRRKVFLLLLASYISVLILAMAINIVYYQKVENRMLENANRSSLIMLEQLKIDMDNKIKQVYDLSNSMVFNNKLHMLLKGNETVYSYNELMKDMINYTKSNFIYDYYIYFAKKDEVVTATIKIGTEHFYKYFYQYEGKDYEEWLSSMQSYHFRDFLPAARLNAYDSQSMRVITFLQSIPVTRGNNLGQAVILIDESMITAVIDKMCWASGAHIYVLDKKGNVVLASKQAPALSGEIKLIADSSSGIKEIKNDSDTVTVCYQTSDETRWKFVMVTPKSTFLNEINRMKIERNILLLMCLLTGSGLAYLLTYRNYKPIKEISDIIKDEGVHDPLRPLNEYAYIKSSIAVAIEKKNKLTEVIGMQVPIMRTSYLVKLLKGYPCNMDTEKESLDFLRLEFVSDDFIVIIAEISSQTDFFKSHSEREWALARFTLINICDELFGSLLKNYCIEIDQNRIAFIINIPAEKDSICTKSEIGTLLTTFNEVLSNHCYLSVHFGVSMSHSGIIQLRECYDEAVKSLEYSTFKGEGTLTFFDELLEVERYYYYPIDMETQLINLLRSGDYNHAEDMIDTLFDINFKSRQISLDTGRCLIVDMAGTFTKVLNTVLAKEREATVSIDELVDRILSCSNIVHMHNKVKELARDICRLISNYHSNPSEKMANDIMDYVKDHYMDPSLSLISIADHFDITPQYVSMIFKRQKSENLKDFISRVKLEKAKELLADNNMTMADIAKKLGYANELGVFRLFKKYEGITPGAYKKNTGLE